MKVDIVLEKLQKNEFLDKRNIYIYLYITKKYTRRDNGNY